MNEKLGLQSVAPPPDGLVRLRTRLGQGGRNWRCAKWPAVAAAVVLAGVVVLGARPTRSDLPAWALDHPQFRVTDPDSPPLTLVRGVSRPLIRSANVTAYLVYVGGPADRPAAPAHQ